MPVDYSKWDALELSDDSDIEVHPNVDKRSFIRAKQNQIHQERDHRRHQIATYKYERIINDGLLKRISTLLSALKAHAHEANTRDPGEVAFKAVVSTASNTEDDTPPPRPEGVHSEEQELPKYSKMMATLLDQVKKALDEKKPDDRYKGMIEEVQGHHDKVSNLQKELLEKLEELEKQDGKKITSEGLREGFNSSHVSKSTPADKKGESSTEAELLNPGFRSSNSASPKETPGTAKVDEDQEIEASPLAKRFAQIKVNDSSASHNFIRENPQILRQESETDGILGLAFEAALEDKFEYARQCVHQALLLQYCRGLGGVQGVQMFFKGITTKGHKAQEMFFKDVQDTYSRIRNRTREILKEREEQPEGVEQIQLHPMDENTIITISIPPANSQDPEEQKAREIYDGFPAIMRKALETESLDEVNKVLGDMKVAEAEEMVNLFGEAGILSLEEQIIDATTEEGKQQLKEMEKKNAEEKETGKTEDPE
ncbi:hypothetical protein N3K66_002695 [Trichothecium roseum]|uniref:Uncharacterized protein n=1 Tax=Trichothecium roseum TaxID=47278 RepID=A0ACC0VB43_9HYPO|nr:hypothetical protein N3K66_002695 [Trichothecium roseum]